MPESVPRVSSRVGAHRWTAAGRSHHGCSRRGFAGTMIGASILLARETPTQKLAPYECGSRLSRRPRASVVKFYLVAMIFLLFDIEIAFLYPWALALRDLGWPGFFQIVTFFLILLVGFVYVCARAAGLGIGAPRAAGVPKAVGAHGRAQSPHGHEHGLDRSFRPHEHRRELVQWARRSAIWPRSSASRVRHRDDAMAASRYDIARFGAEVFAARRAVGPDDCRRPSRARWRPPWPRL